MIKTIKRISRVVVKAIKDDWARENKLWEHSGETSPMMYPAQTKRPLRAVTVFKGPNGVFSVWQDGDLWSVEKAPEYLDHMYSSGVTDIKTRNPKQESDKHWDSFRSRTNAMHAARKWAGEETTPTHPVPNRRGLVAHSRAKS